MMMMMMIYIGIPVIIGNTQPVPLLTKHCYTAEYGTGNQDRLDY